MKLPGKILSTAVAALALSLAGGCGSSSTTNPYLGPGGTGYGGGTCIQGGGISQINAGFTSSQVSLTNTRLYLSAPAGGGGGFTQGMFNAHSTTGSSLVVNVTGFSQNGGPIGPLSANGSLLLSSSDVQWAMSRSGLWFGYGYGNGGYNQQQFCVTQISVDLVVEPSLVNPRVLSGLVTANFNMGAPLTILMGP